MGDLERAQKAYERVLNLNPTSWRALTQAAHVCRCREDYPRVSRHEIYPFEFSLFYFWIFIQYYLAINGRP